MSGLKLKPAFFFFNDTATTEIYTLSLHDALPIYLARDLHSARAAAETEARLRDSNASLWTAERLRVSLRDRLQDQPLFVVSNREPYMHVFDGKEIGRAHV